MANFQELTFNLESKYKVWKCFRPYFSKQKKLGLYRDKSNILLEKFFFELCSYFAIEQFVECGAYDAYASRYIKKNFPSIEVYAFEANPYVYTNFKQQIQSMGISYFPSAISNRIGVTNLVVKSKDTKTWSNESFLGEVSTRELGSKIFEINTTTLDQEFREKFTKKPTGLWIDVEGSNHLLFKGARNFFKSKIVDVIFVETQIDSVWEREFSAQELCNNFLEVGYTPIARDCPFHWGCNLIFVRSENEHALQKLIEEFDNQFDSITIPFFTKLDLRTQMRKLKRVILRNLNPSKRKKVHKLFSFFGSKSSSDELDEK